MKRTSCPACGVRTAYDDGSHCAGNAAALMPDGVPVVTLPRIPYAGGWDGGYSFSRSICAGNYSFGARVEGSLQRVKLWVSYGQPAGVDFYNRAGRTTHANILAWICLSVVTIHAWHGDRRWTQEFPVGAVFTTAHLGLYPETARILDCIAVPTPTQPQAQVDSLHRW